MKSLLLRQSALKIAGKISFLIFAILLPALAFAQPPPSLTDSLIVLPAAIPSGQTTVSLQISLVNSVPISGITGRMIYDSSILAPIIDSISGFVSAERVGRGMALSNFAAKSPQPGVVNFLMLTNFFPIEKIDPGSGPVCQINFNVLTAGDTTTCVYFENDPDPIGIRNQLSDANGYIVIPSLQPGSLVIGAGSPTGNCFPVEPIDNTGDLNLNGLAYEITDFVTFANYFIYGDVVFNINQIQQALASDVNRDGLTLRVADLVFLERVILGEINPLPAPTIASASDTARFEIVQTADQLVLSYTSPIELSGFFLRLAFLGTAGDPVRLDSSPNMDFGSQIYPGELRFLLVSSLQTPLGKIPAGNGPLLSIPFNGNLRGVEIQTSTTEGEEIATTGSYSIDSRGDLNADGLLTPSDVVSELNCVLNQAQNCPISVADLNCDGSLTTSDVVLMLNASFLGEVLPQCP